MKAKLVRYLNHLSNAQEVPQEVKEEHLRVWKCNYESQKPEYLKSYIQQHFDDISKPESE